MTRLKALELFGFKSFADRTRFEFPDGITVVVGPNGSGKSNVVDAIKWVLGEQSVRSLRGREMTDVIFAGSVSRKPLNSAETSLVFDNSARLLPVEADEVQIGRRVYRSGESEYLINGEVCRLRDIRDLFSGTGAATEAYSVIEQGRVDALLMASGKDRRAVFEEAAGITKFRARRTESLRRLERAEQNRQRLADIVGEVAARLETVRHQAARARRWRQMTDRLRRLRLVAARQDLAEVDGAVAAVESTLARLRADLEATEIAATEAAAEASARGLEDQELVPQVTQLRGVVTAERERAAAAEARRQPLLERMGEWEGELARIDQEGRTSAALLRSAVDAATAAATSSSALTAERGALEERLTACQQAAAGSNSDVEQARTRVEHLAARLEDLAAQRQRLLLEADRADGRQEEARRQAADSRLRIDTARRRMDTTAEALAAREGNLQALVQRLEATGRDIGAAEESVRERTVALESGWRELAGWQAKLEACRERRGLLEEFAGRHEGVAEAARRLLAAAAADAEGSAVRGIIGEMIDAPMEWASLVDVALGAMAQDIAVTSLDRFAGWLQPWAATDAGKGALATGGRIGIVAPGPIPTDDQPDVAADGGVVGRLDRLIASADATAANTPAAWLLSQTWVVATFDDARRLAAAHATLHFVARDGQSRRGGRYEVGSVAGALGIVARRAELKSLNLRHDELVRRSDDHVTMVADLQAGLAAAGQAVRQLQSRRQHDAESVAAAKGDAARLAREQESAREALTAAEQAVAALEHRSGEAERLRDEITTRLGVTEAELAELRRERTRMEQSILDIDRSRGSLTEEIQRLRIELATGRERLDRAEHDAAARAAQVAERRSARLSIHARHDAIRDRLHTTELDVLRAGSLLAEATWAAEHADASLGSLVARQEAIRAAAVAATDTATSARAAAGRLGDQIHARELEAGEARHRRVRIVERIRDEYDIDIEAAGSAEATEGPGATEHATEEEIPSDRPALDSAIDELKRKLASMTTVNLEALTESEQLAERLAGLEAQLADVTNAKLAIEQLIARIDEDSRRLLTETIETVRGHFRTLFERVFGGGQADIILEPGVDVLETSVEIVARPPGKEPRSISLLSGGEKTMTCVALLLAIFRSRPSPFCVLDEVDAALDDANVDRFVGVLREFKNTQIIVVTHRKATMAAANTLYGVTMEESGVSKRVSVRFESTAATAPVPLRAAA